MSQPTFQPPPSQRPYMPPPPTPPPKKHTGLLIAIIGGIIILGLVLFGSCIAGLASLSGVESSTGPTITAPSSSYESEASEQPTEVTTTSGSTGNIAKSDIKLHVKTLAQKCYGYGVGCNVTYRVVVDGAYMDDWPDSGEVEVSYKVTGPEDGAETDSFVITLEDGQYEKPSEDYTSTRSRSVKLKVIVTDVEYSE